MEYSLGNSFCQQMLRLPHDFGGLPPQLEGNPDLEGEEADRAVRAYERECLALLEDKHRAMRAELQQSIADAVIHHKASKAAVAFQPTF